MFVFGSILLFLFKGSAHAAESGYMRFYNEYLNVPGFEAWKFLNLFIFIGLMVYVLKQPLGDAFKARRDDIRAELIKAEQDKKEALAKLTAAEGKLAQLETEKQNILERAKIEAADEKKRISDALKLETERLRQQVKDDLARIEIQKRAELRRFSAEESIRLAEEKLRERIDTGTDARLIKANIQEIGRLN